MMRSIFVIMLVVLVVFSQGLPLWAEEQDTGVMTDGDGAPAQTESLQPDSGVTAPGAEATTQDTNESGADTESGGGNPEEGGD